MLITSAVESIAEPKPGVALHTYLSYGDVSKILLRGLELLANVHPVAQGQSPSENTYNIPLKLRFFQWYVRLSKP